MAQFCRTFNTLPNGADECGGEIERLGIHDHAGGTPAVTELPGLIGVGRAGYPAPPPSEPDVRFSRIRLSGWWFTSPRTDKPSRGRL